MSIGQNSRTQKFQSPYMEKIRTDIIDLSYNIEECPTVNDYITD